LWSTLQNDLFLAVQQSLLEFKPSKHQKLPSPPTLHHKALFTELVALLKPLQILTDRFQSNNVMSSRVIITIGKAIYDVHQVVPNHLLNFKSKLLKNVESRFKGIVRQEVYVLAAILDPRVKTKPYKLAIPLAKTISEEQAIATAEKKFHETVVQSELSMPADHSGGNSDKLVRLFMGSDSPIPELMVNLTLHFFSCNNLRIIYYRKLNLLLPQP